VPALRGRVNRRTLPDFGSDNKAIRIWPVVAMTERSTTSGEGPALLSLDSHPTSSTVEGLSCCVLIEYPKVQRSIWSKSKKFLRGLREQVGTDSVPLQFARDMEVLKKGSPLWVFVQNCVSEANDLIAPMGNHGELARPRLCQSASPYLLTFGDDVPVEIGVEIGAPVVTPPTVGV
jgi:hypothetical protein